ncbi:MAG: galactokinase [Anaerolineaceae bacterium]|nr:galactokinase [Anaerolineaceae bacterium]
MTQENNPIPGNIRFISIAPGRVNLLGGHVDYNDGAVLPVAIDLTVKIVGSPREDDYLCLQTSAFEETVVIDLKHLEEKVDFKGNPLPGWAMYPASIAWAMQEEGHTIKGTEAVFTSNVPIGSGLSSSAAVEVAFAALWREMHGLALDNMTLSRLCQKAENEYVGVNCGLMDQFASAHGIEGHALHFDTRSLDWYAVPLSNEIGLIVADSGVRHSLAGSAYNDRRDECEQAVIILKEHLPDIKALRDVSVNQFEEFKNFLPEIIQRRARHIISECARVELAVDLLKEGDIKGFGEIMFQAHASLRDDYEVSCPELDTLIEIASELPGCYGARLTGGGFGGSTINVVDLDQIEPFKEALHSAYKSKYDHPSRVIQCLPGRGVWVQNSNSIKP